MILREQWTVDLSKSNRGEDFRKEVFVRRTEQQAKENKELDEEEGDAWAARLARRRAAPRCFGAHRLAPI